MKKKIYDIAVVGGGAIGRSVALTLTRAEEDVVLIYPKEGDKTSASLAAGAMIDTFGELPHDTSASYEEEVTFGLAAQKMYPQWLQSISEESGKQIFYNKGMFIIANNAGSDDLDVLDRITHEMDDRHEKYDIVNPREVPGLKPNHQYKAFKAVFMKSALSVDSTSILETIENCLLKSKYCTYVDDSIISLAKKGNLWTLKTKKSQAMYAHKVIICAGAYSLQLLGEKTTKQLGTFPELFYGKGISCMVSSEINFPYAIRTPNRAAACGLHVVPRANGEVYLGASNYFGMDLENTDSVNTGEVADVLNGCMMEINTSLRKSSFESARYGLRPVSSYGKPLVGETKLPGLFIASGTYRMGVHFSPLIAQIITNKILGKSSLIPNPFEINTKKVKEEKTFGIGAQALMDVMLHPQGALPYNKDQELATFIRVLFEMAILGSNKHKELLKKLQRIHRRVSNLKEQEAMRIFYEVLRNELPEGGPYPK